MNYNMFILSKLMQLTLDKSEKAHGEFTGVQGTGNRNYRDIFQVCQVLVFSSF